MIRDRKPARDMVEILWNAHAANMRLLLQFCTPQNNLAGSEVTPCTNWKTFSSTPPYEQKHTYHHYRKTAAHCIEQMQAHAKADSSRFPLSLSLSPAFSYVLSTPGVLAPSRSLSPEPGVGSRAAGHRGAPPTPVARWSQSAGPRSRP
jgi:hypothetical protein